MKAKVRIAIIVLIALGCAGCDQAAKSIARARLPLDHTISLLDGSIRLERAENLGGFLSLGDALPSAVRGALFTAGGAFLVVATMIWICRSRHPTSLQTVGAALICGGGLGNLIDRVVHDGRVTDFLNLGIGAVRTGIFNVADMALMVGVALLIVSSAADRRPRRRG